MQTHSQDETEPRSQPRYGVVDLVWLVALIAAFIRFAQVASLNEASIFLGIFFFLPVLVFPAPQNLLVLVLSAFAFSGILLGLAANWFVIFYCVTLFAMFLMLSARNIRERIRCQALALLAAILLGSVANQLAPPRRLVWLRESQQAYPKIDFAPRLASLRPAIPVESRANFSKDIDFASVYADSPYRVHQLSRVHDAAYEKFIGRLGFGMARMISLHPDSLRIPDLEDIGFDSKQVFEASEVARTWYLSAKPAFEIENMGPLTDEELLQRTYGNFVHPATLGFSIERKQAVGFSTHGFRSPLPRFAHGTDLLRIKRLELVSLLNFESPRVYVIDHFPRMDQLRGEWTQTRELDAFELKGLEQLKRGARTSMDDQSTPERMLGAIPMIEQCQQCHDGEIGDLLGAFSYQFETPNH